MVIFHMNSSMQIWWSEIHNTHLSFSFIFANIQLYLCELCVFCAKRYAVPAFRCSSIQLSVNHNMHWQFTTNWGLHQYYCKSGGSLYDHEQWLPWWVHSKWTMAALMSAQHMNNGCPDECTAHEQWLPWSSWTMYHLYISISMHRSTFLFVS